MSKMYEVCPDCKKEGEFSLGGDGPAWECINCGAVFIDPDLTKRYVENNDFKDLFPSLVNPQECDEYFGGGKLYFEEDIKVHTVDKEVLKKRLTSAFDKIQDIAKYNDLLLSPVTLAAMTEISIAMDDLGLEGIK